jgi:hypothetical protein
MKKIFLPGLLLFAVSITSFINAETEPFYPHVKSFPGDPAPSAYTGTAVPLDSGLVMLVLSGATVALSMLTGKVKKKGNKQDV